MSQSGGKDKLTPRNKSASASILLHQHCHNVVKLFTLCHKVREKTSSHREINQRQRAYSYINNITMLLNFSHCHKVGQKTGPQAARDKATLVSVSQHKHVTNTRI